MPSFPTDLSRARARTCARTRARALARELAPVAPIDAWTSLRADLGHWLSIPKTSQASVTASLAGKTPSKPAASPSVSALSLSGFTWFPTRTRRVWWSTGSGRLSIPERESPLPLALTPTGNPHSSLVGSVPTSLGEGSAKGLITSRSFRGAKPSDSARES